MAKKNYVLFDLDGTLIDTAPDLTYALNVVRAEKELPPLELSQARPVVSLGGTAMIKLAFNITHDDPEFNDTRQKFLDVYRENIYCKTRLFDGMEQVLNTLDNLQLQWGIVTNKPEWLTTPLLQQMQLDSRASCVISGDTLPYAKPSPEPLLHACSLMGCVANESVYIGDAKRDVEAGINAGIETIIASYGYIEAHAKLEDWGANTIIEHPLDILDWLEINAID